MYCIFDKRNNILAQRQQLESLRRKRNNNAHLKNKLSCFLFESLKFLIFRNWYPQKFLFECKLVLLIYYLVYPPSHTKSPNFNLLVFVKVAQSCLTLCDHMDCTVHGILQARILELVAVPLSRGSSQLRDQIQVSRNAGRFFTTEPPGKPTWHYGWRWKDN